MVYCCGVSRGMVVVHSKASSTALMKSSKLCPSSVVNHSHDDLKSLSKPKKPGTTSSLNLKPLVVITGSKVFHSQSPMVEMVSLILLLLMLLMLLTTGSIIVVTSILFHSAGTFPLFKSAGVNPFGNLNSLGSVTMVNPSGRFVGSFKSILVAPSGIWKSSGMPLAPQGMLNLVGSFNTKAEPAAIKAKRIKQRILSGVGGG